MTLCRKMLLFLLFLCSSPVVLRGEGEPPWVLYEKGRFSFFQGRLGESLVYLRKAVLSSPAPFPEALYLTGKVYYQQGNLRLAERNYKAALDSSGELQIPDQRYQILYDLAEVARGKGEEEHFEEILSGITSEETERYEYPAVLETLYVKNIQEKGLRQFFLLFRRPLTWAQRAHRELGVYYFENGRYQRALSHNLNALLELFSQGVKELKREGGTFAFPRDSQAILDEDPEYAFSFLSRKMSHYNPQFVLKRDPQTLEVLTPQKQFNHLVNYLSKRDPDFLFDGVTYTLDRFRESERVLPFLQDHHFYLSFYYLANSFYGEGQERIAKEVWGYLKERQEAQEWRKAAEIQYHKPNLGEIDSS